MIGRVDRWLCRAPVADWVVGPAALAITLGLAAGCLVIGQPWFALACVALIPVAANALHSWYSLVGTVLLAIAARTVNVEFAVAASPRLAEVSILLGVGVSALVRGMLVDPDALSYEARELA